jgi:hypothetical protein
VIVANSTKLLFLLLDIFITRKLCETKYYDEDFIGNKKINHDKILVVGVFGGYRKINAPTTYFNNILHFLK